MRNRLLSKQFGAAIIASSAIFIGACATPTGPAVAASPGSGTVQSIEMVQEDARNGVGLGTVAGAVIGGVLGNQIGEGSGNTAATIAGAAGGAYAGNRIENSRRQPSDAYKITVRMDGGGYQSVVQRSATGLSVGDRVRVGNNSVTEY
ncbi:glycine zipper 2TM domain-containing protein [Uliginosibacterium sp. H1]|uniref:glycine zipper 2TM domain-containing protein n=1 Tax=Uliginosibacterium sp. H1 TaxID=3114757 RepID=UPI002E180E08|nr:glycine zipper 2TM domain-containing protein [Uliginosibacterium sp. H1]